MDKKYGRILNKALRLRNLARYDCYAKISEEGVSEVDDLTKYMITILEREIKAN
ncbi:MAG: hypothetical protein ABIC82_05775 [bacterium]